MRRTIIACVVTALAVGAGTATAASLVTSAQIKDGTIRERDLSRALKKKLNRAGKPGPAGAQGPAGANGATGAPGMKGADGASGVNGKDGADGADGANAANGADGKDGLDAIERVSDFSDEWTAHTDAFGAIAPTFTADGLKFGTFADGDAHSGARYSLGVALENIASLSYRQRVDQVGPHGVVNAAPYLILELEGGEHVIYSPNTQPGAAQDLNQWSTERVLDGGVRYDDDAGTGPDISWDDLLADHGDEIVETVRIAAGWGGDYTADSASVVSDLQIELIGRGHADVRFSFGS